MVCFELDSRAGYLVYSTTVMPGFSVPFASASSIMDFAMRSLTEPPGFCISSLTRTLACLASSGRARSTLTIGVAPTVSR